jgi:hypothetical protein
VSGNESMLFNTRKRLRTEQSGAHPQPPAFLVKAQEIASHERTRTARGHIPSKTELSSEPWYF